MAPDPGAIRTIGCNLANLVPDATVLADIQPAVDRAQSTTIQVLLAPTRSNRCIVDPPPMRIPKRFARHEARGLGRPHATRTYSCLPPVRTPVCRSALDPDTCSVRIGRVAQLRKPPGDIRRITEMSRRLLRLDAANAPHVAPGPPNTTRPNLSTATILSPRAIFTMPRSTE